MNSIFPYRERLPYKYKTKLEYPIDLSTAKDHLRVDYDDDDKQIERLIKAATQKAEKYIQGDIAVTSNRLKQYEFVGNYINIKEPNLIEDSSVKAYYKDDTEIEIKEVDKNYSSFDIEFTTTVDANPLLIDFSTGFLECDELIQQAILVKLEDLYSVERSSYKTKDYNHNKAFESLLNEYKSIYL